MWPEKESDIAHNNLRQALYQLRKLLGDQEQPIQPYLQATRQAVQFNPAAVYSLDVEQFLGALEAGDLDKAAALYTGELLPGFTCDSLPFEEWLRQEREQLHRLALAALHELAQDCLRAGRLDEAQAAAQRQLALEPWHESAHRQLMLAYALAGERGSALAQYERCRELLNEELGIDPGAETITLLEEITAGRFERVSEQDGILPPPCIRHNLPADTTPLIGRQSELTQIRGLLGEDRRRLLTIAGPGGMGKTWLALAVGKSLLEDYSDGVYFVDLAPLSHADEIILAIASALDYQAPDEVEDVYAHLLSTLSHRRMLLILDNFEHLLDGAGMVNDILRACPAVNILVTSRQWLNLASENRFELGGLDYPASLSPHDAQAYTAVQLFMDIGRRIRPDFRLNEENISDVVRICQLVQGMPLGLVLAAPWLALLSPAEIADDIAKGLEFLAADLADLPPRQRSLQAIFEGTWTMMTAAEQAALARLSIFRGGFTRKAADQVAEANLRTQLSLLNKSLLQRGKESGRFGMHELLRQFASIQRRAADAAGRTALVHCRYYSQMVEEETRRGLGFWPIQLPRKLAADRDNISRAWDYAVQNGLAAELSAMVRGVAMYSIAQGIMPDTIIDQAVKALQQRGLADSHPALLHLRLIALKIRFGHEEVSTVEHAYFGFLPQLMAQDDPELRFWAYEQMAHYINDARDPQALVMIGNAYQAALETADPLLIKLAEAEAMWFRVDQDLQDHTDLARMQEMLAYFEPDYPDSFVVYGLLGALSSHNLSIEEYDQAIHYGKQSLNIARGWRDLLWMSFAVDLLAEGYRQAGQPGKVGELYSDILEWHLAIGQVWQILGFIWARSSCNRSLVGSAETAVSFLSMIYHHPEVVPFHRQMIEDSRDEYVQELGDEVFEAAWEKGKDMDLDTAAEKLRDTLGQQ